FGSLLASVFWPVVLPCACCWAFTSCASQRCAKVSASTAIEAETNRAGASEVLVRMTVSPVKGCPNVLWSPAELPRFKSRAPAGSTRLAALTRIDRGAAGSVGSRQGSKRNGESAVRPRSRPQSGEFSAADAARIPRARGERLPEPHRDHSRAAAPLLRRILCSLAAACFGAGETWHQARRYYRGD